MTTEETKDCLGKCPYCSSENIDYICPNLFELDNTLRYSVTCNDCNGEFNEDYNIEYAETVYAPNNMKD